MLRAISLRESWMREIRTSGLTRERAPNGPSLLYNSCSVFDHSWATALCSPRKRQSKIRPAKHAKRREKLHRGFGESSHSKLPFSFRVFSRISRALPSQAAAFLAL